MLKKVCIFAKERLRGAQSKLLTFVYKCMKKKEKIMSAEDSFVSSDCSIESNIRKWVDTELERLASRGKGGSKFHLEDDLDDNVGSVCCADYTMKFNGIYWVIDLVINSEEDSPIWNDVKNNVPAQFAAVLNGAPEWFLYRLSSNTSDKKEFYGFDPNEGESGSLLPIEIFGLKDFWRAEGFDSLICSHDKTFFTECLNAF